jgi:hypothetical protein
VGFSRARGVSKNSKNTFLIALHAWRLEKLEKLCIFLHARCLQKLAQSTYIEEIIVFMSNPCLLIEAMGSRKNPTDNRKNPIKNQGKHLIN